MLERDGKLERTRKKALSVNIPANDYQTVLQ
jgi:hypothetical protein